MANPARHLCRSIFQVTRQIPVKRKCPPQCLVRHRTAAPVRQLSTTCLRRADEPPPRRPAQPAETDLDEADEADDTDPSEYLTPSTPISVADLDPNERADYEVLSKPQQEEYLALQNHYAAMFESVDADAALDEIAMQVDRQVDSEVEPLDFPEDQMRRQDMNFWAVDEDDEFGQVEEEEPWDDSAITSVAHSELEVHREVREYTRVIAWDMPLLNQFAKPFQPPTEATPLRFRYTTYMGEVHPAAKKVVVQFCTKDLPNLNEAQRAKLIKLVGPRYNPDTDMVKMSCEKFEAAAQNKRYLGDLVNKLLDEAKTGADKFEDIPVDLRHHKSKKRAEFPEEWKMKPARVQQLLSARQSQRLLQASEIPIVNDAETVKSYVRTLSGNRGGRAQRTL
ncbi:37S ribosomal protein S24, mitochondrial [Elasticomyces elasticus]|uniref:37S ribosomal protein S24, mitochondrial n=1 Tax=Exophiala sideris TaxID=1016849 RepID=A0ABR0JSJ3_9EURO|nr:37S ribosomal protein S24, mitochondrial [Elasticomyces elasticus]KAK5040580.1 37S ribosomal protein S24, mitochondrial [Exophiala sideris]KAK5042995.1 37S ribosomal protein S24, mitochondrial [Exophiala sideris]KAK5068958.1 37S ribosomal protein S24, mitochondrial [Exophiala sideris]KAK5186555.1 37S ribosomal protein S24, mitochondrial [Eurotiomycetes sp. CCFEE 6388]